MKKRDLIIGISGQNQIQHIIPILEKKYNVVDLRNDHKNKVIRTIVWLFAIRKVDIIYNVFTTTHFWIQASAAKLIRKKVITHWIGTDVLHVTEGKINPKRLKSVDKHFVCFDELQNELLSKGIQADVLPIIPFNLKFTVNKMPEKHAVLIYMPNGREGFYGYEVLKNVFRHVSQIKFYIVANSNAQLFSEFENVEVMGTLSLEQMEELYDKVSIVIRNVKHDGLSMSVVEALAKGKKVIWNYSFPNILYAKTGEEICKKLDTIISQPPKVDFKAHEFVATAFTRDKFLNTFSEALEELYES